MPLDNQQLNTADDFSEFDFDADDVLIKDEDKVVLKNQKIKSVDLQIKTANKPAMSKRLKAEPPLELKKLHINSKSDIKDLREDLIKQANLQKEKMLSLSREGEGLFYDEKDDEEIEKFKKNTALNGNANIDFLVRKLISEIDIVSTLKIDLIGRLKNIISSFLRDIRTASATEEILQRSTDSGGLNLSPASARKIMDFANNEQKKINFVVKDNDALISIKEGEEKYFEKSLKLLKFPKMKLLKEGVADAKNIKSMPAEIANDKNDKIVNLRRDDNSKSRSNINRVKDFTSQKKELNIPANLRIPEIVAPEAVKNLPIVFSAEPIKKSEVLEQISSAKRDISFQDFKIDEVLESINEEFAQDKKNIENQNKKASWFAKLFKRKTTESVKSIKSKVHKVESLKQEESKVTDSELKVSKAENSIDGKVSSLQEQKIQPAQPFIRRVVLNKFAVDNRQKIEDIKISHPHLVGPIEELSEMTLADFRRLGSTPEDSVGKVKEKIEISSKESFNQKISAIQSWQKSQPNQLYIELGRQSLINKLAVEELINQYNLDNKPTLTKEEFDLISKLNKELRY